jgi:hypothetical protein
LTIRPGWRSKGIKFINLDDEINNAICVPFRQTTKLVDLRGPSFRGLHCKEGEHRRWHLQKTKQEG